MGFGEEAYDIHQSIKNNLALLKSRDNLFERQFSPITRNRKVEKFAAVKTSIRLRFNQKLVKEKQEDQLKYLASILITIVLILCIYYFGDDFYRLVVHQVGQG